jgi:hypothetical protein
LEEQKEERDTGATKSRLVTFEGSIDRVNGKTGPSFVVESKEIYKRMSQRNRTCKTSYRQRGIEVKKKQISEKK